MYRPSSVRSNLTVGRDRLPDHRFRSDDGGICGLRGGSRLDVHSFAGGTLSSGLEGALVSVSGSKVVLEDRHYNRGTLFRHGDSGINNSCNSVVPLASMAMLMVPAFMPEWRIVLTIVLPTNAVVLAPAYVVPAFIPGWEMVLMIFLPPNVEVLALVLAVRAFMPEWTIVTTIVLPPNVEVLAPISEVPAVMPGWEIVSIVFLPPIVEQVFALAALVQAFSPEWTINFTIVLPPKVKVLALVWVVLDWLPVTMIVLTSIVLDYLVPECMSEPITIWQTHFMILPTNVSVPSPF